MKGKYFHSSFSNKQSFKEASEPYSVFTFQNRTGATPTDPRQHISSHFFYSQSVNRKPRLSSSVQMAYSLFITNISCHLAAPPHSLCTLCSSAMSLLPFPHLLCVHIGRARRPLEGLLHSWFPPWCLGSPPPFAQTYRSLPPLLLCHPFCPGLKIYFHNQCMLPTTTPNLLSFILWPLAFGCNPLHILISRSVFSSKFFFWPPRDSVTLRHHQSYSEARDLHVHLETCFAFLCENPQMHWLLINARCCVIRFL